MKIRSHDMHPKHKENDKKKLYSQWDLQPKISLHFKTLHFFEKLGILLRKPLYLITMRYERASFTKLERLRSKNTVDIPQNRYIRTMKGKFKIP